MNPLTCKKCGRKIMTVAEYGQPGECRACLNERMRGYKRAQYVAAFRARRRSISHDEIVYGGYKPYETIGRGRVV
jgi:hypothetical protein